MNKISFLFFTFFYCLQTLAQSGQVLVEYNYSDSNITRVDTLIADQSRMIFLRGDTYKSIDKSNEIKDSRIKVNKLDVNLSKNILSTNNKTDSLLIKSFNRGNISYVLDKVPFIKWEIVDDYKEVLGIKCTKAVGIFRGSKIIAWFSKDIRIPFGPWKFKGLPGLILEVYNDDDLNIEKWVANKIHFPFEKFVDYSVLKYTRVDYLDYKQIVLQREKKIKERIARLKARTPAGYQLQSTTINRSGIERIYEWELEDEKKD